MPESTVLLLPNFMSRKERRKAKESNAKQSKKNQKRQHQNDESKLEERTE
jgi:hypothetical protein